MKIEFCRQIFEKKNIQISNLKKIRPVGFELVHADEWAYKHGEASCRFSQVCERAQKIKGRMKRRVALS